MAFEIHESDDGYRYDRYGNWYPYVEDESYSPKSEGGNNMATLLEAARAYEPPQTLNIADLEKVDVNSEMKEGTGKNKEGEEFTYRYIEQDGKEYRVPGSVLEGMKAIAQKMPNLKHVTVIKTGSGMATRYQVMPFQ